jgi:hypothetical protein
MESDLAKVPLQLSSLAPSTTSHDWLSGLFDGDTLHRVSAAEAIYNLMHVISNSEFIGSCLPMMTWVSQIRG